MKPLLLAALLVSGACLAVPGSSAVVIRALAAPPDCYAIQDGDRRAACLAARDRSPSACYSVHDIDARAACRARVTGNAQECASIPSADRREACRAGVW